MLTISPIESSLHLRIPCTSKELIALIEECDKANKQFGFTLSWDCFINFMISHYQGKVVDSFFYVIDYPLRKHQSNGVPYYENWGIR